MARPCLKRSPARYFRNLGAPQPPVAYLPEAQTAKWLCLQVAVDVAFSVEALILFLGSTDRRAVQSRSPNFGTRHPFSLQISWVRFPVPTPSAFEPSTSLPGLLVQRRQPGLCPKRRSLCIRPACQGRQIGPLCTVHMADGFENSHLLGTENRATSYCVTRKHVANHARLRQPMTQG